MPVGRDCETDIAAMVSIAAELIFYSLKFKAYYDLFIPLIIIFGIRFIIS